VGLDGERLRGGRLTGERLERASDRPVPDLRAFILAAGEDVLAVGGDGDRQDHLGVALVLLDLLAGGCVPESDRVIEAGGGDRLAVGAPRDRVDRVGVSVERADDRRLLLLLGQRDTGGDDCREECGQYAWISPQEAAHGVILCAGFWWESVGWET